MPCFVCYLPWCALFIYLFFFLLLFGAGTVYSFNKQRNTVKRNKNTQPLKFLQKDKVFTHNSFLYKCIFYIPYFQLFWKSFQAFRQSCTFFKGEATKISGRGQKKNKTNAREDRKIFRDISHLWGAHVSLSLAFNFLPRIIYIGILINSWPVSLFSGVRRYPFLLSLSHFFVPAISADSLYRDPDESSDYVTIPMPGKHTVRWLAIHIHACNCATWGREKEREAKRDFSDISYFKAF